MASRSGERSKKRSTSPLDEPMRRMSARKTENLSVCAPLQRMDPRSPLGGEALLAATRRDGDLPLGGDRLDHVGLLLLTLEVLLVIAVAEHAEVAGHAAVGVDRDARQDLLALVEAEAIQIEVRQPDPVRVVRRVLAIVGVNRDLEGLEV